jgi:predicted transposase/invertase (TIGR01784 family)
MSTDNICRYLSENFPGDFASWLLGDRPAYIQDLKTELKAEPIRADCVVSLYPPEQILHLEFQTTPASTPPIPIRMLDYYARLRRQYHQPIQQVVIYLQETASESVLIDRFKDINTFHRYRVVRLWEEDPAPLLASPGLIPLATLAQTNSPAALLGQVAGKVDTIDLPDQQREISACAQLLAGLRYDNRLIRAFLREELMQESVVYQEIIQRGIQQGRQQGELAVILRQLTRKLGSVSPEIQAKLQSLSAEKLEELAEVLLDLSTVQDLANWLEAQG